MAEIFKVTSMASRLSWRRRIVAFSKGHIYIRLYTKLHSQNYNSCHKSSFRQDNRLIFMKSVIYKPAGYPTRMVPLLSSAPTVRKYPVFWGLERAQCWSVEINPRVGDGQTFSLKYKKNHQVFTAVTRYNADRT